MKRFASLGLVLLLAACAPTVSVQNTVLPTLVSVTVKQDGSNEIVLQGRYFSAQPGENSYVVMGADASGQGGFRIRDVREWSPNRIVIGAPQGVGVGFVVVVVDGVRSNPLPSPR